MFYVFIDFETQQVHLQLNSEQGAACFYDFDKALEYANEMAHVLIYRVVVGRAA